MKATKTIFCVSLVLTGFSMAQANLLTNGDLDKTFADPLPPNLPKPANWSADGVLSISGPINDMLSSETWAGPAPTPVTHDGANGDDWGVFFKGFQGNPTAGGLNANLWQDNAATAGSLYTLTGWAGAEANHMADSHWFRLVFLDAGMNTISSVDLQLDATLQTDNGQPFFYKQYSLNGTAPGGTAFVRSEVSMVNGMNNPLGGGQAFVVDDFDLEAQSVPEPATLTVLAVGGMAALIRRKRASR